MSEFEHPVSILAFCAKQQEREKPVCLVVLTDTHGGSVRRVGAMMAVTDDKAVGYLSNGCVDADIITQARSALASDSSKTLQYGEGSPFTDLQLPCGGSMTVLLWPNPHSNMINEGVRALKQSREMWSLTLPERDVTLHYVPQTRLRICGGDADALALAKLARSSGFEVEIWNTDTAQFGELGKVQALNLPSHLPELDDDPWTALVCLFHDLEWEVPVLRQALSGPAFYIGAVGSKRTHASRVAALREIGVGEGKIARINGPVGLVPSSRDASRLALSTLAQIIDAERKLDTQIGNGVCAILLAAGDSSRFGAPDKLLASYRGKPLMQQSAEILDPFNLESKSAIVQDNTPKRVEIAAAHGWSVIENRAPEKGKAHSISLGIEAALNLLSTTHILILLADMPNLDVQVLRRLLESKHSADVICVRAGEVRLPPLILSRSVAQRILPRLMQGEAGLLSYLSPDDSLLDIPISQHSAFDIDTQEDLLSYNTDERQNG